MGDDFRFLTLNFPNAHSPFSAGLQLHQLNVQWRLDLLCRYVFAKVKESHTTSPNKEAVNGKRPLEGAGLGSDTPNKRPASAQPAALADPGLLQKLHKANNVRLAPLNKATTHHGLLRFASICNDRL